MSEKGHETGIKIGDLVEFCLDPRYPALKKDLSSSKLELNINVGVVLTVPDEYGYVKIQTAYSPYSYGGAGEQIEVHTEFCKVVSR